MYSSNSEPQSASSGMSVWYVVNGTPASRSLPKMVGVVNIPGRNRPGSSRSPLDCAVYAYCRFGNVPAHNEANERSCTVKRRAMWASTGTSSAR